MQEILVQPDVRATETIISVRDLRVRYGSTIAVDGVSLDIRRGEIFGILGPNGAGKTTTVECIGGLRTPDEGTISVLGLDARRDQSRRTRRQRHRRGEFGQRDPIGARDVWLCH